MLEHAARLLWRAETAGASQNVQSQGAISSEGSANWPCGKMTCARKRRLSCPEEEDAIRRKSWMMLRRSEGGLQSVRQSPRKSWCTFTGEETATSRRKDAMSSHRHEEETEAEIELVETSNDAENDENDEKDESKSKNISDNEGESEDKTQADGVAVPSRPLQNEAAPIKMQDSAMGLSAEATLSLSRAHFKIYWCQRT